MIYLVHRDRDYAGPDEPIVRIYSDAELDRAKKRNELDILMVRVSYALASLDPSKQKEVVALVEHFAGLYEHRKNYASFPQSR